MQDGADDEDFPTNRHIRCILNEPHSMSERKTCATFHGLPGICLFVPRKTYVMLTNCGW